MIVDGSYMAWVRPTRRVHLALSVGMTVTGILLAALGMTGDRHAVRPSAPLGRTADSVVGRGNGGGSGTPAGPVPPAPFVRFAPPAPGKVSARPRPKPGAARVEHAVRAPVPARAPAPAQVPAPAPAPAPAAHDAPHPPEVSHPVAPAPPRSPERLPEQPPAHRLKH